MLIGKNGDGYIQRVQPQQQRFLPNHFRRGLGPAICCFKITEMHGFGNTYKVGDVVKITNLPNLCFSSFEKIVEKMAEQYRKIRKKVCADHITF